MKGDLSRDSFERALHYSAVRLQQGRIVTDADWNEQADITRYRAERLARDAIGACGAPLDAAGYALSAETNALAVLAVNANVAWVTAEDGVLLTTSNGGADWTLADLQTAAHLRAVAQAGGVGWVVGDGGVVRKTGDAGLTWTAQHAGTLRALRGVAVVDALHAWAVGDGGIVVATSDGGVTWALAQTDAARLYAVHFIDESFGIAVGRSGAIVSTSDGGQSWARAASGTGAHLRALARFGVARIWAAGQSGTIVRSTDGGVNWQPCNTPSDATLHAIAFRDALEGWAVGAGGVGLHSIDGGANWQRDDPGIDSTLRGLSLFGGDPGWAVGDASVALRVDAGSPAAPQVTLPAVNLSIGPGRCYVNGTLCELEARASYANQPDGGAGARLAPGVHLLYLDAWQRHLSALEAPAMREIALGGPDTATRARTLAQVRALPLPMTSPPDWNCDSSIAAWDALLERRRPRLAARAQPQLAAANLCEIAATAGFRRLENQLYRVEVHEGGATPTFKWSRENGSVAYAVVSLSVDTAQQRTTVRVAARGRDANLDIAAHDRVELIDDEAEATRRAGTLFEYLADGDDELELVLAGVPPGALGQDPARHPVLRRWDHRPPAGTNLLPIVEASWIELEDGVEVRFEQGEYRPGDYWQVPARTISADVEWPRDDDGDPVAREPAGIADAYCRLGIVEVDADGSVTVASDCRELFPPLSALEQLLYVSGDGQDAAPNARLPQPLAVRVARGSVPIAGAGVRFEIESGGGRLGGGMMSFETSTDAEGQARCDWTLGPRATARGRFQRVRASLLDADRRALPGQVVVFCATASLSLQYVSGDGQQAAAGANLPHPLEVRVANGADGVPGVVLSASVRQGGGSIVGPATLTTGPDGLAAFGWRLGAGGSQRVDVQLVASDGSAVQRSSFNAGIATSSGGGCDITIGRGGQFERLDSALLARLLEQGRGHACLCFLPGEHELDNLEARAGDEAMRLSLHGCGPTSRLRVRRNVALSGFAALELRDLAIQMTGGDGIALQRNDELRITGLSFERRAATNTPGLEVAGVGRVNVAGCEIAVSPRAPALVFDAIARECQVRHNRIGGVVSFYGLPGPDRSSELLDRLRNVNQLRLESNTARLHFADNSVSLLTIGASVVERLFGLNATGLFETAVLHGNTIDAQRNVFVSSLLSFGNNSLVAQPTDGSAPYGVMIANRSAAAGNVAVAVGDQAILHFITPPSGGFSGAGNEVFTSPQQ